MDILETMINKLRALPENRVNEIVDAAFKHFAWTTEEMDGATAESIKVLSHEDKVRFIMGADPLFEEGGLIDFLNEQGLISGEAA